ncbi:hypothetical protein [Diaphorobacter aerolatus]|uniref:Uncharacterized protein n=1 Tax=Diaphorobacter aerolatus TaxID=1288495 RepID=A0A7H0GKB1_9BURK|nr:hypothetical protein [Diaphorobacter aerolatus]QNP48727.1 hypothetical protein H9K75_00175 [Diaphorobacter aerolatus]
MGDYGSARRTSYKNCTALWFGYQFNTVNCKKSPTVSVDNFVEKWHRTRRKAAWRGGFDKMIKKSSLNFPYESMTCTMKCASCEASWRVRACGALTTLAVDYYELSFARKPEPIYV